MNKKASLTLALIILGTLTLLGSAFGVIRTASIFSYKSVYKQNWGHIRCVQEDDYDIVYKKYLDNVQLFKCDDYTNECLIQITQPKKTFQDAEGKYRICDINGNNCGGTNKYRVNYGKPDSFTINVGKSAKFSTGLLVTNEDTTLITKKAKSFYIIGVEDGKIYRQESCVLSSELRGKVLSDGLNELSKTGTNSQQNYMIDFILSETKTYNYDGKEVICQARQLYEINQETFKDGSTRAIQGNMIKSVECCPQEANCGDNFRFKENNERTCNYNSECANGGNPVATDGTHYVVYECVSGTCQKSQERFTDCTITSECIRKYGDGYVCDLSYSNWGKCIKSTKPEYCGDGVCQELNGETRQTCPDDCELICSEDQVLVTTKSRKYILFGEERIKKECVSDAPNYLKWFLIGLAIILLFLFRGQILALIKFLGSKIGIG